MLRAPVDDVAVEVEDGDLLPRCRTSPARRRPVVLLVRDVACRPAPGSRARARRRTRARRRGPRRAPRSATTVPRSAASRTWSSSGAGRAPRFGRRPPRAGAADPRGRRARRCPACSFVNCSGALLCGADADELGLDADLVEQPLEVDVLRLEPGVAHAARRVDDDAVGVRADVERVGARVLQASRAPSCRARGARGSRRRAPRRGRTSARARRAGRA